MNCLTRGFLLAFGLVFVVLGAFMGIFEARRASADAERAAGLEPISAAALEDREIGRDTLVEGALSARNPARFRDFVAYVREEYRGRDKDGDQTWREDERVTPQLLIEAGGLVQLANQDYIISGDLVRWREEGPLYYSSFEGGTKRYEGLVAGQTVTAIGTVVPGPEGNLLQAEVVFAGDRSAYIAARRSDAAWLPWFGVIFSVVGLVVMAAGVFIRR